MFYTYQWIRRDGTPYYVGKGSKYRAYSDQGHAVTKPEDKARILLQYWESEEKALEMETWYINLYGRKDLGTGILRNIIEGGGQPPSQRGLKRSEASIQKWRESIKGYQVTDETRQKLSKVQRGKPKPPHHGESVSRGKKGRVSGRGECLHVRWHVNRGKVNSSCALCQETQESHAKRSRGAVQL